MENITVKHFKKTDDPEIYVYSVPDGIIIYEIRLNVVSRDIRFKATKKVKPKPVKVATKDIAPLDKQKNSKKSKVVKKSLER